MSRWGGAGWLVVLDRHELACRRGRIRRGVGCRAGVAWQVALVWLGIVWLVALGGTASWQGWDG